MRTIVSLTIKAYIKIEKKGHLSICDREGVKEVREETVLFSL